MSSELTIRLMYGTDIGPDFLETVSALSAVTLTTEQATVIFRRRMRQQLQTFVALFDGRVIGTAALFIETKFLHNGGKVGHIEDVAVHKASQGRGVGRALVQRLVEECRREGCYKVILDCAEHNVPWYDGLGFHQWAHGMRMDLPH